MKKYYFLFGEGSKINQVICAILIILPVFAYGAGIGWMSPMVVLLQSDHSPRGTPLSDTEVSWMASIGYGVCVPATYALACMGDRMGRKAALLFISAMTAGCWIVKLASMEPWAFVFARSLFGIPTAGSYVICPLYIKEISEDSVRGVLGTLVILAHTTGNLFLYIIGDVLNYRTILWVCLSLPTLHLVLFLMMPDSPSYLMKHGREDEAARVLAWLRCRREDDSVVQRELELMKKEQKNDEESSKFILKAVLTDKILCRAFRIAMVVAVAREVCGAIPVLNFAGDIFANASEGTNLVLTPNQQAMMLGAVQVTGSALGSSVVEKAGRKPLLFIAALVSGLSMCILASWFVARMYGLWVPGWLPIVTLCICIFCDAAGLSVVSVVIAGEIFSFKYRGTVIASTMGVAALVAFLQMLFFKPLATAVGPYVAFYFFGIVCLLAAVYVILVIPETKMRTLEEIHHDLKTKKEKEAELKGLKEVEAATTE